MLFSEMQALRFLRETPPGAEGGGGGGAEISPVVDEQKPVSARDRAMEKFESPESTPPETGPPKTEEAPPAVKPDSEPPKPPAEDPLEKRFKDTQAAFHKTSEQLAQERKTREELQKKIDLASKYVDWDKLTAYEQSQALEKANQPVTHAELAELERQKTEKAEKAEAEQLEAARADAEAKFIEGYKGKHPELIPHITSGAARGVALKIAQDNPDLNLDQIGEKVAEHFRAHEEGVRKRIADELNTRREVLDGAGAPRSSGSMPESGSEGKPEDYSAGGELNERKARLTRQRTLI